jgi:hypothetical protein
MEKNYGLIFNCGCTLIGKAWWFCPSHEAQVLAIVKEANKPESTGLCQPMSTLKPTTSKGWEPL